MKLATLKETPEGGNPRDGTLAVVSYDLREAVRVPEIAPTLQVALDNWHELAPELRAVWRLLNQGEVQPGDVFPFDPAACAAPLPRAYQWLDGSAYLSHAERVHKARNAVLPHSFATEPLMHQGGSAHLLGPRDPIALASEMWGIDFEAEVAVITGDVPMGISAADAGRHIHLVMLANDVSLRNLIPVEGAKGSGFVQSKPAVAFAPVAVSPDSIGGAWDGGKLNLPLLSWVNGQLSGEPNAGVDMAFDFPRLIAHAAHTRPLAAGTIIGSGAVSNRDSAVGVSCIIERRMIEVLESGQPGTPFLSFGDRVRIEMVDAFDNDVFGAIEQEVVRYPGPGF